MATSAWSETRLSTLSSEEHFRIRGEGSTRLETFVDAAFAFAVTMLVISVDDVPRTYSEFVDALKSIPAFIASFFQVIMFWLGHRNWSQRFALEDRTAIALSLVLVCGILVIVFPLRVVFGSGFSYLSGGFFPYPFQVDWPEMRQIFIIYGTGFSVMCSLIVLLYIHAWRQREWLALNTQELLVTRSKIIFWAIPAGAGLISMLVALFTQGFGVIYAGFVYFLLFVVLPVQRIYERRQLRSSL
ncbi:MAG: TMEM175 family protein [Pseudohongiella sp.]|nr:TMEM175 family protein [Pseudohongiella sp.]